MIINSLKKVWIVALILFLCMIVSLYTANTRLMENLRGNLIFTTSDNIKNIKKIIIENSSEKLTLYEDESVWRIEEADNYYVNFHKIQSLMNAIANAKIGNFLASELKNDLTWTTIKIFDANNKKLGEAMVSNASELDEHYIKYPKDDKIYISTWKLQLPENVISWVPQHNNLVDGVDVNSISKQDVTISRETRGSSFVYAQNKSTYHRFEYVKIFDILTNLQYEKVLSAQEFDENKYPYVEKIHISTFDGFVIDLSVYSNYEEYWLKIDISTTRLPSYKVKDYVEKNSFLFKNWWFKLPQDEGKILFMMKL